MPKRPQKMKPNQIKMDISKQQETQQQKRTAAISRPLPAGDWGGGAVCVQMDVEANPPKIQIPHSNKSYKG